MTGMIFNDHIRKELYNEYKGSEKKKTVILDDGNKYMLKFTNPTRNQKTREKISYINNSVSEYIGCNIAKIIGLSAQDTIIGLYNIGNKNKIACACRDLCRGDERLYEAETIELGSLDFEFNITFDAAEKAFERIKDVSDKDLRSFYYKQFILDALICNKDRHNGNWGIISDNVNTRISPIYDCGSSLFPLLTDEDISTINLQNLVLSSYSAIRDNEGNKINYHSFINSGINQNVNEALKEIICHINLNKINSFIETIPYISANRKEFYKETVNLAYTKTLLPALSKILQPKVNIDYEKSKLFEFYKINMELIKDLDMFSPATIVINNIRLNVMKVSENQAIIYDNEKCKAAVYIRSNNDDIARTITQFYVNVLGRECSCDRYMKDLNVRIENNEITNEVHNDYSNIPDSSEDFIDSVTADWSNEVNCFPTRKVNKDIAPEFPEK